MKQEGEGLLKRDPGLLPPKSRKLLERVGNEKITSIQLVRTPLTSTTKTLLNIATFGKLEKYLKESNIDKLFHLRMIINGKYALEKNSVVEFSTDNKIEKNSNVLDLYLPPNFNVSINELINNTRNQMGNQKFSDYEARTNNCSIFIENVLTSNGIQNSEAMQFLTQDTKELFQKFPTISEKIINLATETGSVVNRLIEGNGQVKDEFYNFQLHRCKIKI